MTLIITVLEKATTEYGGYTILGLITFVVIYLLCQYFSHGLHRYPGPFLAKFTNLWRFFENYTRRSEWTHLRLHRQYGDVVRLGPNVLSFGDPAAVKSIYGLNKGFVKSTFYPVQMATSRGERLPSLFSTRDETFHANLRRSVNHAFSMTAMVQYEPMVNETTEIFLDQTEKLFTSDRGDNYNRRNNSNSPEDPDVDQTAVCNFARWLQFFAFDVIGSITYSKRHGFIEKNEDIDGIISQLARIFDYSGPVGQMPWLDCIFWKNPVLMLMSKWGIKDGSSPVAKFAKARMDERRKYDLLDTTADTGSGNGMGKAEILLPDEDSKKEKKQQTTGNLHQRADLLTMFLNAKCQRPEFMTEKEVLTMAVSMAFAGSETTAISLSSVFYFLLKNPICLARLREEIDAAVACGDIQDRPTGLVSWSESQKLPFLDACVKESFRLHPAAGLPLERIVPEPGLEIAGHFVPGGTIVGCSAWVIHRREEIFGPDVDDFRPDRWLRPKRGESESAFAERLKAMNGYMFHFGAGSRTCIGKNISLMEIYKLIPSFFRRFDISLANPDQEWKTHNAWFVRQLNFNTTFRSRTKKTIS